MNAEYIGWCIKRLQEMYKSIPKMILKKANVTNKQTPCVDIELRSVEISEDRFRESFLQLSPEDREVMEPWATAIENIQESFNVIKKHINCMTSFNDNPILAEEKLAIIKQELCQFEREHGSTLNKILYEIFLYEVDIEKGVVRSYLFSKVKEFTISMTALNAFKKDNSDYNSDSDSYLITIRQSLTDSEVNRVSMLYAKYNEIMKAFNNTSKNITTQDLVSIQTVYMDQFCRKYGREMCETVIGLRLFCCLGSDNETLMKKRYVALTPFNNLLDIMYKITLIKCT
jgi:hypothetical protein